MTKPKPFPWGSELRTTLICTIQGGSWWRFDGIITLSRYLHDDESIHTNSQYIGLNFRINPYYLLIGETINPKTGVWTPWERIVAYFNIYEPNNSDERKTIEVQKNVCNYLREYGQLPTPSKLKKYILANSCHQQLLRELSSFDANSYMLRDIEQAWLDWIPREKELRYSQKIRPPYGWKKVVIESILNFIRFPIKGRLKIELKTIEPFTPPPKNPRGRPRENNYL